MSVGDGDPLGKRHGGVLGDRVVERAQLGEQTRRRRGVEQGTPAAADHARQHGAGRVEVRQNVHLPHALEVRDRRLEAAYGHEARVGDEEVDGAVVALGLHDEPADRSLIGHVEGPAGAPDPLGDGRGPRRIAVGDDHVAGALADEALGQRLPDPAGSPGHDGDAIAKLHGAGG